MTTRRVFIAVEPCYADALRAKSAHLRHQARSWWLARKAEARRSASTYAEFRRELGKATQERRERRDAGDLLESMGALVGVHLRRELAARGWDRSWPELAPGEASLAGRRLGSTDNPGASGETSGPAPDQRWVGALLVTLDPKLVDQLQRATHAVSRTAVTYLAAGQQVPDDVHPVVTTGDVLRAAVRRATADWFPGALVDD